MPHPIGPAPSFNFPRWSYEPTASPYTRTVGITARTGTARDQHTGAGTIPPRAMKLKWSGFGATDGRGKINGHVASKNRSGAYARTKVTPTNPQSTFQLGARNLFTALSQGWRALTQAQRDAWDSVVADFAKTDVFGDLRNPTGKNLYSRLNINLQNVGQAVITDPPLPAGGGSVVAGAVVMTNGGAKTVAYTEATDGHKIQVWATPGVSPGKKFVKNDLRLIATFDGAAASPFDMATAYEARFGEPAVGTRVAVQLVSVNETTGEMGTPSRGSTLTV